MLVVGISIILGLSVDHGARGCMQACRDGFKPVFSSSLSLATISVVMLNIIFRIGIASKKDLEASRRTLLPARIFTNSWTPAAGNGDARPEILADDAALTRAVTFASITE